MPLLMPLTLGDRVSLTKHHFIFTNGNLNICSGDHFIASICCRLFMNNIEKIWWKTNGFDQLWRPDSWNMKYQLNCSQFCFRCSEPRTRQSSISWMRSVKVPCTRRVFMINPITSNNCWGGRLTRTSACHIAIQSTVLLKPRAQSEWLSPCSQFDHRWYKDTFTLKPISAFMSIRYNPLRPTAIQKLLEIIGRVRLYPSCSFATALDSDINQTTGSGGHPSMWENWCMHATVCLLRAGQPKSAGDTAKSGQFIGQFSWVTGDPIGLKGLIEHCLF